MKKSKKLLTTDEIKTVTEHPASFGSSELRRAVHDAHELYKNGVDGCTFDWYERIKNICNSALAARFEETV